MFKYVLGVVIIFLLLVDVFIFFDFKKYLKVYENELVENQCKVKLSTCRRNRFQSVTINIVDVINSGCYKMDTINDKADN